VPVVGQHALSVLHALAASWGTGMPASALGQKIPRTTPHCGCWFAVTYVLH
jgi:hypothetical protein